MIDKLFGTIEDIYFTIVSDTKSDTDTVVIIDQETSNLNETLSIFRAQAKETMYIGKDGNKYRLLKLAVLILNYIMHEDDGVFSKYEQEYLSDYILKKFTRFSEEEQQDLQQVMNERASLEDILTLTKENDITLRPIDMILDSIVEYVKDQPSYHLPLCNILNALME